MYYLALLLGMVFLGMLYLSFQWEEHQYQEIENVMDDDSGEIIPSEPSNTEVGQLWKGEIRNKEVRIEKGWRNEIYVKIERPLTVEARVEHANPLRRTTRFFEELFTPRFAVTLAGESTEILAYSEEEEPARALLRRWNNPEPNQILQNIHHVDLTKEGLTVQFYQPDFNLDRLTDRAKAAVKLYEFIPEQLTNVEPVTSSERASGEELDPPE